jgi:hypothetical protein
MARRERQDSANMPCAFCPIRPMGDCLIGVTEERRLPVSYGKARRSVNATHREFALVKQALRVARRLI